MRSKKAKISAVDESLKCISDYFQHKNSEEQETDDSVFAKFLSCELAKIKNDDIKRHAKRKLTDIVFDALEEEAQKQLLQQPQEVQYVMLGDSSTVQFVHVSES